MIYKRIMVSAAVAVLSIPVSSLAYEYGSEETQKLMESMVRDLGGHDGVNRNSGKTMACTYGGTRKVTLARKENLTTYNAIYSNCREKDSIRDGIYEIVIKGDEVITSTSRRSINGELFDAAMEGDSAKVKRLVKARADVNYTESIPKEGGGHIDEWSPLMSATVAGKPEIVRMLVSSGAWVNYMNSLAVGPLWLAANRGDLEIVKYLAKHGAYVNNSNYEDVTPLMAAAMNGHIGVTGFLIASGAAVNAVHREGDSALMFALSKGYTAIASQLITSGATVNIANRYGVTPLHIAVAEGNQEGVKLLLAAGADRKARTTNGKTALDVARDRGFTAIAEMLEK